MIIYFRYDQGPPETVTNLGKFEWTVQDDLVAKVDIEQVPYFNAPIFTENKQQIGKIDEIFGNIRDYYVSIKLSDNIKASSFEKHAKVFQKISSYEIFSCTPFSDPSKQIHNSYYILQLFIDPAKLLPLQRFLPKPPGTVEKRAGRGGRGTGGSRGGRGGSRGGFGGRGGGNTRGGPLLIINVFHHV